MNKISRPATSRARAVPPKANPTAQEAVCASRSSAGCQFLFKDLLLFGPNHLNGSIHVFYSAPDRCIPHGFTQKYPIGEK